MDRHEPVQTISELRHIAVLIALAPLVVLLAAGTGMVFAATTMVMLLIGAARELDQAFWNLAPVRRISST